MVKWTNLYFVRAVLLLLFALVAAGYHVIEGSLLLGLALILCVPLYVAARWYARKVLWPNDRKHL